jgi:hypothetical protein
MKINSFISPHGLMLPSFKKNHTIFTEYYLSYLLQIWHALPSIQVVWSFLEK